MAARAVLRSIKKKSHLRQYAPTSSGSSSNKAADEFDDDDVVVVLGTKQTIRNGGQLGN